jgi:hypothetical protein
MARHHGLAPLGNIRLLTLASRTFTLVKWDLDNSPIMKKGAGMPLDLFKPGGTPYMAQGHDGARNSQVCRLRVSYTNLA